jgi:HAE1 family hydrophobic/amphiphilic exporter-1
VQATYPGANPKTISETVAAPLEQAINGVEGMQDIRSSSTNTGACTITITFEIGRNADLAAVDVQNRVNSALGRLPVDVRTNGVTVTKASAGFLAAIGFYADNNRYDSLFISNYLDRYVRDALKRVPGVANVIIFGERRFAMRLWLNPNMLAGHGLTAGDVTNALREQNVQVAAGRIGQPPAPAGHGVPGRLRHHGVRAYGKLTLSCGPLQHSLDKYG